MIEEAEVIKSGEMCLRIVLDRAAVGLSVTVQAHPRVEDFMRNMGTGERVDVTTVGRYWEPMREGISLLAYIAPPLRIEGDGRPFITIDKLGQPLLITQDERGRETLGEPLVNLSFLKLVGISEGHGVTFGIRQVSSIPGLRKLRDQLGEAARRFYVDYLRPVDVSVTISTQELQR